MWPLICIHCGGEIPDGSLTCELCGAETEYEKRYDYHPLDVPEIRQLKPAAEEPDQEAEEFLSEDIPEGESAEDELYEEQPEDSCETEEDEEVPLSNGMRPVKKVAGVIKKLFRSLIPVFIAVIMLAGTGNSAWADNPVQNARNSVVRVVSVVFWGDEAVASASGTGVCVGDNGKGPEYILTNRHVVDPEDEELVDFLSLFDFVSSVGSSRSSITEEVYILTGTNVYSVEYNGNVILSDREDLALIRLSKPLKERKAAAFGKSAAVNVTDSVYAIGFPAIADIDDHYSSYASSWESYLKESFPSGIENMTVTQGTVSRKDVILNGVNHIQHEADISHGNSGGPLVDQRGRVIGINTLINVDSDAASKKQYSIDVDTVKDFLNRNSVNYKEASAVPIPGKWIIVPAVVALALALTAAGLAAKRKKDLISRETPDRTDGADEADTGFEKSPETAGETDTGHSRVVFVSTSFAEGSKDAGGSVPASSVPGEREKLGGFSPADSFKAAEEKPPVKKEPSETIIHTSFGKKDEKTGADEKIPEPKGENERKAGFTDSSEFDV